MPININTGDYDPLDPVQKAQITDYVAGVLRRNPGISNKDLLLQIGQRSGVHVDQYDAIVLQNLIRDALAENAAADAANSSPGAPISPTVIPNVFDDPADSGRIITQYVVIITDPTTGDRTTSAEVSVSDSPLSPSDILETINMNRPAYIASLGSGPRSALGIGDADFQVIILSISHGR